ncbi:uncharacterized protein LOC112348859 [Selaginella moellendorffii]|uniref:uncharacterized protein LOC112348859 n=1 Tax=Selaginella moellendorffii TaxID=88036 RepID=UPI000D1C3D99|nr:uncharacterized protein LOC112348859 [Selaginella moellendorffii]|eukprot:XP_024537918.1 uncharacterized protein LOC112348859 [Selaginella moellendorffii]
MPVPLLPRSKYFHARGQSTLRHWTRNRDRDLQASGIEASRRDSGGESCCILGPLLQPHCSVQDLAKNERSRHCTRVLPVADQRSLLQAPSEIDAGGVRAQRIHVWNSCPRPLPCRGVHKAKWLVEEFKGTGMSPGSLVVLHNLRFLQRLGLWTRPRDGLQAQQRLLHSSMRCVAPGGSRRPVKSSRPWPSEAWPHTG